MSFLTYYGSESYEYVYKSAGNLSEYKIHNCKSGNFREDFIFADSVKRHICDAKISRLGHDFTISENDSDFREMILFSRNFAYAKFREYKPSRKFPNLQ